jgi:hypothetical protein
MGKGGNLRGTNEGEILGPEEVDLPLAWVARIRDGFKCGLGIQPDGGRHFKAGKLLSNCQHA